MGVTCGKLVVMMAGVDVGVVLKELIVEGLDIVVEMLSAIAVVAIVVVMATSRVSNVVDESTGGSVDNGVPMGGKFELTIVKSLVPTVDEMKLS